MFACHWLNRDCRPCRQSCRRPADAGRASRAVHEHVVPLVEDGDSPVAVGNAGESEGSVGIALGEREVFAVGIAEADIALGERVGYRSSRCCRAADPACGSCARW